MPAYVIAHITIHDRARYSDYEAGFMDIFAAHNGEVVVVDEEAELIEGTYESTRTVVLRFADADAARGWITSPEYQEIAVARHEAATTDCIIVDGFV